MAVTTHSASLCTLTWDTKDPGLSLQLQSHHPDGEAISLPHKLQPCLGLPFNNQYLAGRCKTLLLRGAQ